MPPTVDLLRQAQRMLEESRRASRRLTDAVLRSEAGVASAQQQLAEALEALEFARKQRPWDQEALRLAETNERTREMGTGK